MRLKQAVGEAAATAKVRLSGGKGAQQDSVRLAVAADCPQRPPAATHLALRAWAGSPAMHRPSRQAKRSAGSFILPGDTLEAGQPPESVGRRGRVACRAQGCLL